MIDTASPSELAQVAVALVGVGFSFWGLSDIARRQAMLIRDGVNGQRMFWIRSRMRQEQLRMLGHLVLLLCGTASIFLDPPDYHHGSLFISLQGKIRIWTLMAVTVILALKTIFDVIDRRRLESFSWDRIERRTHGRA